MTTAARGAETWIAVGEAALVELPLAVLAAEAVAPSPVTPRGVGDPRPGVAS